MVEVAATLSLLDVLLGLGLAAGVTVGIMELGKFYQQQEWFIRGWVNTQIYNIFIRKSQQAATEAKKEADEEVYGSTGAAGSAGRNPNGNIGPKTAGDTQAGLGYTVISSGTGELHTAALGSLSIEKLLDSVARSKNRVIDLQKSIELTRQTIEGYQQLSEWRNNGVAMIVYPDGTINHVYVTKEVYDFAVGLIDTYGEGHGYYMASETILDAYKVPVEVFKAEPGKLLSMKIVKNGIEYENSITPDGEVYYWCGVNQYTNNAFTYLFSNSPFSAKYRQTDDSGVTHEWVDNDPITYNDIYMFAISAQLPIKTTKSDYVVFPAEPQVKTNNSLDLSWEELGEVGATVTGSPNEYLKQGEGSYVYPVVSSAEVFNGVDNKSPLIEIPLAPAGSFGLGVPYIETPWVNTDSDVESRLLPFPVATDFIPGVLTDEEVKAAAAAIPNVITGELALDGTPDAPMVPLTSPLPATLTDPTPLGNLPTSNIVPQYGGGMAHVYCMYYPGSENNYYPDFCDWLWVQYSEATIQTIWNNPFDGVIGAYELYLTPEVQSTEPVRCGFLRGTSGGLVSKRYYEIDMGTLVVGEKFGNYLDYSPYTKVGIYLPFIGIVDLEADDIIGTGVNVKYRIDAYNGTCVAFITVAKNNFDIILYQFNGNCSVELPMAGGSQASILAGNMMANASANAATKQANAQSAQASANMVSGIGSAVAGLGMAFGGGGLAGAGNIIGGISQAGSAYLTRDSAIEATKAMGDATATAQKLSAKGSVSVTGSFGGSSGALGGKKPYLIVKRPRYIVADGYANEYGYPAYKSIVLGECTGYTQVRECHVTSTTATEEEKSLITKLLKAGVYVS